MLDIGDSSVCQSESPTQWSSPLETLMRSQSRTSRAHNGGAGQGHDSSLRSHPSARRELYLSIVALATLECLDHQLQAHQLFVSLVRMAVDLQHPSRRAARMRAVLYGAAEADAQGLLLQHGDGSRVSQGQRALPPKTSVLAASVEDVLEGRVGEA